jgi:hypothetical protein
MREKELAERNPFIVWYRIHPENGKSEKLNGPPEGGSFVRDVEKPVSWRPMLDGSIKMGNFESELALKKQEESVDEKVEVQAVRPTATQTQPKTSADPKKDDKPIK